MRTRRTSAIVTVLAVATLAASACSFTGSIRDGRCRVPQPGRAPRRRPRAPAPRSARLAVVRPTGHAPAPGPTGAGAMDRCHTAALTGALSSPDAGAGQRYSTLTLTNTGGAAVHRARLRRARPGRRGPGRRCRRPRCGRRHRRPRQSPCHRAVAPRPVLHWSAIPGTGDAAAARASRPPRPCGSSHPTRPTPVGALDRRPGV